MRMQEATKAFAEKTLSARCGLLLPPQGLVQASFILLKDEGNYTTATWLRMIKLKLSSSVQSLETLQHSPGLLISHGITTSPYPSHPSRPATL